jgi:apolipoprotein N-acyltransferase
VASLGGLGLVALAAAWPSAAAAVLLLCPASRRPGRHAGVAGFATVAALGFGTLRLASPVDGPTVRVAAVTVDFPAPLTSMEQLRGAEDLLFARSALAASRGAQVVVWNEVATLVDPVEEPALVARASAFARTHRVDLVAAYGIVRSRAPFRYENVYRWFGADGAPVERYAKHFLPIGEPAVAGTEPLRAHDRPWGRAAGALCYDYDSPALARAHARDGAGVVLLPSSDWRGIDPQHTELARVRAIEGGFSILRPVRAATSAAIDPQGRFRATLSPWEENDRVLVATIPARQARTLYAAAGDAPALALGLALVMGGFLARRANA